MKKTAILILLATVLLASSAQAAAYLKFDGVKGDSAAAGHKDWIHIESFSWGTTNTCARGGSVTFRVDGAEARAQLQRMCAAAVPIPMPVYEIDGVVHELEGARLTNCQGSTSDQFTMNFSSCRTHSRASAGGGGGAGKVSIHDISITKNSAREASAPSISEVVVTKVNVEPRKATVVLDGAQLQAQLANMPRSTAGIEIPQLDLSINGGPTWTFHGTHILYQDVFIPSNTTGRRSRVTSLTITFDSMTGPMGAWEPAR